MDSLKALTNEELLSRTSAIVSQERKITVQLLRHLREIEARQLYADRGYPSLFEFLVRELRFSESAAYRRIQATRLVKDVPETEAKIAQGELTLTTAAKVQSTLRKAPVEEKRRVAALLEGKSTGQNMRGNPAATGDYFASGRSCGKRITSRMLA